MRESQGTHRNSSRALAAAVVLSLLLAACGGGSKGAGSAARRTADPGITKAALVKRGDVICRATDKRQDAALKAYEEKHPNEFPDTATVERMIRKTALPSIKLEIEELAALGSPTGEQLRVNQIISGLEKALKTAWAKPSTLTGEGAGPFTAPDKLAAAYGFKACSKAL